MLVSSSAVCFICWFQVVLAIACVGFKWCFVFHMLVSTGALWPCSINDFAMRLLMWVAELCPYPEVFSD